MHTSREVADLMGIGIDKIRYHIKKKKLIATKREPTKYDRCVYFIENNDFLNFKDWYFDDIRTRTTGVQKIPSVKEYDKNPKNYNEDTRTKVERDRQILEDRQKYNMKFKDISEKWLLKEITIRQIINRNMIEEEY